MSFTIRVVQPSNFLSIAATNLFHAEIKSAIESDAAIILVDLSNIATMSSSSFIAVVKALKLVRLSGRQLFLCTINEQLRMLFELTGLDQMFKAFVDRDEFDRYIQMQGYPTHSSVIEVPRHARYDVDMRQADSLKLAS